MQVRAPGLVAVGEEVGREEDPRDKDDDDAAGEGQPRPLGPMHRTSLRALEGRAVLQQERRY